MGTCSQFGRRVACATSHGPILLFRKPLIYSTLRARPTPVGAGRFKLVRGMLIGSSVAAAKAAAGSLLGEARRSPVLLGEGASGASEGFDQRVAAFSSSGAVQRGVGGAPKFFTHQRGAPGSVSSTVVEPGR